MRHDELPSDDETGPLHRRDIVSDDDVVAERTRAAHASAAAEYALVMQRVFHRYHGSLTGGGDAASGALVAIHELSLALSFGEVFGLLGPNGAGDSRRAGVGKTTPA